MKNDITASKETILFGNDSAVIRKYISGLPGGRTLDCTGITGDYVLAGHVIIKKSDGSYAPMPVTAAVEASDGVAAQPAAYGALPADASYVGVLYRSISVKNPAAAIMYDGVVNTSLLPYPMTDILTAFKTACPHIIFEQDEEA